MPGIVGVISREPAARCRRQTSRMLESMMHETFYESGTCFVPAMGVYAGWIGHNPPGAAAARVTRCAEDVTVIAAGEFVSTSSSQTKTNGQSVDLAGVAKLYEQQGDKFVSDLNGLFSGLVIDPKRRRALLFNDRYGLERIYFHETGEGTYFASEAKALLAILPELRRFDDNGVAQFLAFGCTLGSRTLFRGVTTLEGGTAWVFDADGSRKQRYFVPETWEQQPALTTAAFESAFDETFRRVLPRYLGGSSEIGISLTGGLDTRMIMAALPSDGIRPICYTFSGIGHRTLDERLARKVAETCGLDHRVLRIEHDFLSNFGQYVDRTVFVSDGCAGALGSHEIYLNARARAIGAPVRLTGNFGSEILRSMSTFRPLALANQLLNEDWARLVVSAANIVSEPSVHPVKFAAFREIPWNLFGSLASGRSQVTFRTPYLDNEIVALAFRAPTQTRQTPDVALKFVRRNRPDLANIPTDRGLVEGAGVLRRTARRLFAEVTFKLDYMHKEGLPSWLSPADRLLDSLSRTGVLGLHKYLPYRGWFRRELGQYVGDVMNDPATARLPFWNPTALRDISLAHRQGTKNYLREIHAVLTIEAVDRQLIRGMSSFSDT